MKKGAEVLFQFTPNLIELILSQKMFSELILSSYCCLIIQYMEFFLIDLMQNYFKVQAEVYAVLN